MPLLTDLIMITFSYKIKYIISTHKKMFISFNFLLIFISMQAQSSFVANQKTFSRVREAFSEKEYSIQEAFTSKGLIYPPSEVLLVSYKAEGELQLWVKESDVYKLFKAYNVCKRSGDFGPKRKQGDRQVPEGVYHINVFNPSSSFHLSLGISYPNKSDRILSNASDLGGDIFIHGQCVTIGCLPMTDDIIKEIYVINTLAKGSGQSKIPIYLFPFKYNKLTEYIFYKEYPQHKTLWNNLKSEYFYFKDNSKLRNFSIDSYGNYNFF